MYLLPVPCFNKTTSNSYDFLGTLCIEISLGDMLITRTKKERDCNSTICGNSSVSVSGISHKLKNVSNDSSSGDRITTTGSKSRGYELLPLPQKNFYKTGVSEKKIKIKVKISDGILVQLTSTILSILPFKRHCQLVWLHQIQALNKKTYQSPVLLNNTFCMALLWWMKDSEIYNGRT